MHVWCLIFVIIGATSSPYCVCIYIYHGYIIQFYVYLEEEDKGKYLWIGDGEWKVGEVGAQVEVNKVVLLGRIRLSYQLVLKISWIGLPDEWGKTLLPIVVVIHVSDDDHCYLLARDIVNNFLFLIFLYMFMIFV